MSGPRIFSDDYYARMRELESHGWWNAAMRDVAAGLLADVGLPEAGTVLDAGCGSGQTMGWFLHLNPGWRAVGLDIAAEGVRAARAFGFTAVSRASVLALPVRDQSMDLVISLDVLQHLPLRGGDRAAAREFRRVLKPGGHLLVRTNAQSFPAVPDDPEYDFHKYRVHEVERLLRDAGFRVLRISRLNALLGLAEIPRELRARRADGRDGYHGLLARPNRGPAWAETLKHRWLRLEGRAVRAGWRLPLGRTIIALCRA